MDNQRVLAGITPSGAGELHIGNYLGAVKQMVELQDMYERPLYFIADLHAMTTIHDKAILERNIRTLVLDYIALGVDPTRSILFRQSEVPLVTELMWILGSITSLGHLRRAHAYKDKLQKGNDLEDINWGLFSYPVLMAADILLYKSNLVPVGKDQHQHLEIAREIARSFNTLFGDTFPEPQALSREGTMVILGIDGERKMSKSLHNDIKVFASEQETRTRVQQMVTDPKKVKKHDPGRPEICNVFTLRQLFSSQQVIPTVQQDCRSGKLGCVDCKNALAEDINAYFAPMRSYRHELEQTDGYVEEVLAEGRTAASAIAHEVLSEVKDKVGL